MGFEGPGARSTEPSGVVTSDSALALPPDKLLESSEEPLEPLDSATLGGDPSEEGVADEGGVESSLSTECNSMGPHDAARR